MTARRRFIAVANERYVTERRLTRAVSDSTVVADLLRNRHEYESLVLADLPRGELLDRIEQGQVPAGQIDAGRRRGVLSHRDAGVGARAERVVARKQGGHGILLG